MSKPPLTKTFKKSYFSFYLCKYCKYNSISQSWITQIHFFVHLISDISRVSYIYEHIMNLYYNICTPIGCVCSESIPKHQAEI